MGRGIWSAFLLVLSVFTVGCGGSASAQGPHYPGPYGTPGGNSSGRWIGAETARTRVVRGSNEGTYIGVWVHAPRAPRMARGPMALSLVIDTSGSMMGDRIENARHAAKSLLETLRDGDMVSVVGFASSVTEIIEPTVVSSDTLPRLMSRISEIQADGGTNMYAGLTTGEARMRDLGDSYSIKRVIMISDGHANEGPSDAASLGQVAASGTDYGVQVSSIGVGTGYDEQILNELAIRSSGRLYHLERPAQMARIVEQELGLLSTTVAVDAWIEICPAPGVRILGVESRGGEIRNGKVYFKLGSLFGGQKRDFLVRASIDTREMGDRAAATARLVYRDPGTDRREREQQVPVAYRVVGSAGEAKGADSARVAGMVAMNEATASKFRAVEALNRGDADGAAAELSSVADKYEAQAAAAPASSAVRASLTKKAADARSQGEMARRAKAPGAARGAALELNEDSTADALGGL
jgi:Ca-activated chloride channel family protein